MAWTKTLPVSGTRIIDIPDVFEPNWDAIEDILGEEHYIFTNSLSGRHYPGVLSVMGTATSGDIAAVSPPVTGALYLNTSIGGHVVYDGADWKQINLLEHSEVRAYRATDYSIPYQTYDTLPFDTESYDVLGEYSTSTYTFSAKAEGYYFIKAQGYFSVPANTQVQLIIRIYNESDSLIESRIAYLPSISTDDGLYHSVSCLRYLDAGYYVKVVCWQNSAVGDQTITLSGGSTNNFFNIYRVS